MSPASIVSERIVNQRIKKLYSLFNDVPITKVAKVFKDQYGTGLAQDQVKSLYDFWYKKKQQNYSDRFIISESRKNEVDGWKYVYSKIQKETNQEIADFIYEHWKKYEKQRNR